MLLSFAIFLKRASEIKRDKKFAVTGILFPLISIISIIAVYYLLKPGNPDLNPLLPSEFVTNDNINVPYLWNNETGGDNPDILLNLFTNYDGFPQFHQFPSLSSLNQFLLNDNLKNETYGSYIFNNLNYIDGKYDVTLMYNQSTILSLPTFLGLYGEAVLRNELQDSSLSLVGNEQALSNSEKFSSLAFIFYGPFLIEYGFVFLIPFFSIHIVEEKEKRQKHQLLVSGVSLSNYWIGNLLSDYSIYLVSIVFNISILYMAQISLFIENSFIGPFCIFGLFGILAICCGYLLSFIFQRSETANKWLYSVMALFTVIPYLIIEIALKGMVPNYVNYALCIFPPYCLYYSMVRLSFAVYLKGGLSFIETFAFNDAGLGAIILIMIIECFILIISVIFLDFGFDYVKNILNRKYSSIRFSFDSELLNNCDSDVKNESIFVDSLSSNDSSIIVKHVWKLFKSSSKLTYANRDISLSITDGQCFGLLGPNGAGKTTLIDMLTGLIQPDSGEIIISGFNMNNPPTIFYHKIGVCQQGDVHFPLLTVKEHLLLYARIKQIPKNELLSSVNDSIIAMNLEDHENKLVKELSGGNKRKLAVAIAFTGNPKIVFLDEPSTGMDPVIRRKMWSLIDDMKEDKVIILTTHSMEEADALCQKIAIMVNGALNCLGSSQHLKNTYGNSYRIALKTSPEKVNRVIEYISEICPSSELGRNINGALDFEVPVENLTLGPLFEKLQNADSELEITDYSVSQPTLEQVFLGFAKEQEDSY